MKVWSDTLSVRDLADAAQDVNDLYPGVRIEVWTNDIAIITPARKRKYRFDKVSLHSENGNRPANPGTGERDFTHRMAASWCEHGWWMVEVFRRDPNARIVGYDDYDGVDEFHRLTGYRFIDARSPRERQVVRTLRVA